MISKKQKRLYYFLFLIAIAGIIETISLIIRKNGINFGVVLPMIIGIFMIIYTTLKLRGVKYIIKNRKLRLLSNIFLFIFLFSFIIIQILLRIYAISDQSIKTDYLIILGSGLKGENVSLTLKERLDKGILFLNKFPDVKVVVSGGQGSGETVSEAAAMKKYLIQKQIESDRVLLEDQSTSTNENFIFSKNVINKIDTRQDISVMVITNDFHMMRSKILARRSGFITYGISCDTPWQVYINTYLREYFALIHSYLFDK